MRSSHEPQFGREEIPLIPDALYGMRSFAIRDDGKLLPLHRGRSRPYAPGVNKAGCYSTGVYTLQIGNGTPLSWTVEDTDMLFHEGRPAPAANCICGFYAYFDQTEDTTFMANATEKQVNGIVRATGRAIVGDLGFRAEKLEVIGLVALSAVGAKGRVHRAAYNVAETVANIPMGYYYGVIAANLVIQLASVLFENQAFSVIAGAAAVLVMAMLFVQVAVLFYMVYILKTDGDLLKYQRPSKQMVAKIREQYPDVEMFNTLEEAKEKFPLTKPDQLPK